MEGGREKRREVGWQLVCDSQTDRERERERETEPELEDRQLTEEESRANKLLKPDGALKR